MSALGQWVEVAGLEQARHFDEVVVFVGVRVSKPRFCGVRNVAHPLESRPVNESDIATRREFFYESASNPGPLLGTPSWFLPNRKWVIKESHCAFSLPPILPGGA